MRADDAEIVLDDASAGEVSLSFSKDRLRIVPRTEGATLAGGGGLAVGKPTIVVLPAILNLGPGTQIHVCRLAATARRSLAVRALPVAGLTLVAGAIAAAASVMSDASLPGGFGAPAAFATIEPAPASLLEPAAAVPVEVTAAPVDPADAAAAALRDMTIEAGLIGLNVAVEGGAVRVSGRQSPSQAGDWHRVREAYDMQYGSVAPLLLEVSEEEVGAPLAVASAWLGAAPEITTRTGDVMAVGDVTDDGWSVARIVPGEVHLERDAQTLVIEF